MIKKMEQPENWEQNFWDNFKKFNDLTNNTKEIAYKVNNNPDVFNLPPEILPECIKNYVESKRPQPYA